MDSRGVDAELEEKIDPPGVGLGLASSFWEREGMVGFLVLLLRLWALSVLRSRGVLFPPTMARSLSSVRARVGLGAGSGVESAFIDPSSFKSVPFSSLEGEVTRRRASSKVFGSTER